MMSTWHLESDVVNFSILDYEKALKEKNLLVKTCVTDGTLLYAKEQASGKIFCGTP